MKMGHARSLLVVQLAIGDRFRGEAALTRFFLVSGVPLTLSHGAILKIQPGTYRSMAGIRIPTRTIHSARNSEIKSIYRIFEP